MPKHPRLIRRGAVYYHRAAVPKDIKDTYGKSEEIASLKTKDHQVALREVRKEAARVDALFQAHRDRLARLALPPLQELTDLQVQELGAAFYATMLEEDENERLKGFAEEADFDLYGTDISSVEQIAREMYARGGRPNFVKQVFEETAARMGLDIRLAEASPSWQKLARKFLEQTILAAEAKRKRNTGDVVHTPPIPMVAAAPISTVPEVTLGDLLDLWKRDHLKAGRAEKTAIDTSRIINEFAKYLGHDNAQAITGRQISSYCDMLIHERDLSERTVSTRYLSSIRAVFRKGRSKHVITNDPTDGVKVDVPKKKRERSKGFTEEEANTILSIALNDAALPAGMRERNRLACRWVPWICAYTGARVGEIAQLRKEDFIEEHGVKCIRITPDAGTVKTGQYRHVPLHPHLIKLGILKFVTSRPEGHLFYIDDGRKLSNGRRAYERVANTVGDFVRETAKVTDARIWPNHAWRHRFKTIARDVGMEQRYMDAIQGHADGSASAEYGENTMKALYREIRKMPTYIVESDANRRPSLLNERAEQRSKRELHEETKK